MSNPAPESDDRRFQAILKQLEEQDAHWAQLRDRLAVAQDVEFVFDDSSNASLPRPAPPAIYGIRA